MAKQEGTILITGTIDDITFYEMDGKFYARMKSSLTGKRFWKDKAFEGSRKSARALGVASKLASLLYRTLSKEHKSRSLFQKLTGKIKFMILDGLDAETITTWFQSEYKSTLTIQQSTVENTEANSNKPKAYTPPPPSYDKPVLVLNINKVNKDIKEFQNEIVNSIRTTFKRRKDRLPG